MTRPTRSSHHSATTAALLVLLGVFPARATEPTCPAGEITLSAGLLRATRNGAGADRLSAPTSNFVLPAGVSIDPGTEALSFVVEGDHRLLYQADVPAGGLVAHAEHRGDTIFMLRASPAAQGARIVLRHTGALYRLSARFDSLDLPALATAPQFAKLL